MGRGNPAKALAWVIGISLNLEGSPHIYGEGQSNQFDDSGMGGGGGSSSSSSYGGGGQGGDGGGGTLSEEAENTVQSFMRCLKKGIPYTTMSKDETTADEKWHAAVRSSVTYAPVLSGGRVRKDAQHTKMFHTIKNGNGMCALNNGLTVWEDSVMKKMSTIFQIVEEEDEDMDDEDGEGGVSIKAVLMPGVNPAAARKFLLHDLRTVKMRVLARSDVIHVDVVNDILQSYSYAQRYFTI
jgi:hypothetical protein